MSGCAHSSLSGVLGTALSRLLQEAVPETDIDTRSLPETRVILETEPSILQQAQLSGTRDVVCKTPAEYKANKLNRNEQIKLNSVHYRVTKEQELCKRRLLQNEKIMRAKSAKISERLRTIEKSSFEDDLRSQLTYNRPLNGGQTRSRRPHSYPETRSELTAARSTQCPLCEKIQNIIMMYECEGKHSGVLNGARGHSVCMFSDDQARAFLEILEKNIEKVPPLNPKLRASGLLERSEPLEAWNDTPKPRLRTPVDVTKRNVNFRINQFCADLDARRKGGEGIPREVQDAVERVRLQNASTRRKTAPKHSPIVQEAMKILQLQT
ncbi:uncharacterized protein LOC128239438 [Mya arenaria]|uniref:uncharacterized protein LOC128239438 n=1 Tax=Mya arenaria TaxID=6604 RepID=UPI0022E85DCE|nr:uncharacterized protein LOC128239438 [Mya arenaria]